MESGGTEGVAEGLQRWDPKRYLRKLDPELVRLSRGFLRSRPEKWFPGFAAQWLPLAHSLGVELKLTEIQPYISVPKGLELGFAGTIDGEPIGILYDEQSEQILAEAVSPGSSGMAQSVIMEYLARRFLTSLALAWSGPESSIVKFETAIQPGSIKEAGAMKLGFSVNNRVAQIWMAMGPQCIERLDGLWRRQVRSTHKQPHTAGQLSVEIAQLAVAPSMLVDYMHAGTTIDLEVAVSDLCTLRVANKPWLPGRVCEVGGKLAIEIVAGTVSTLTLPEGSTRLCIDFGSLEVDPAILPEISQVGAVFVTDIPVGSSVAMVVNGDKVAEASLCTYEGRFAISVGG